jgi:multicomponent Na+:H+ antiporter subunit E
MTFIRQLWNWIVLAGLFLRELTLSVWDVALTVLHPSRATRSAIIAVPLDVRSDAGIALFANMITLTPGTVSLHVSDDRSVLYVHVMNYSPDTAQKLKSGFERRVMEVLR